MELLASAPDIRHPSVVCTAPDGRIFVAEDPMDISLPKADAIEGRIICFHPDGRRTVFAEKLYAVFGMQYLEGRLYVLHNPKFSVFADAGSHGTNRFELIEQTNPNPWALNWNDHVPANFRLAMDGFFYLAVGDKGLFGAVDRSGRRVDLRGGGVVRIRPDGTGLEIFCRGVRNILDVAITSEDELFTYDNTDEHEWMGRLTHMVEGGFYGYPFDFIPRRPYTLWMLADYGPGAATGTFAYTDDALPSEFRDNLFLADFGQRNIRRVVLERSGGTFRAARNELLFPDPPPDFRPVGIHETADGSGLLICDWQHLDNKENVNVGRLWRLTNEAATNAAPKPAWFLPAALGKKNIASDNELLAALAHPARSVRLAAQRELQRRLNAAGSERAANFEAALFAVLKNSKQSPPSRWHALWALAPRPGGLPVTTKRARRVAELLDDSDVFLVRQALRWLGQHESAAVEAKVTRQLTHADPSLRFAAATALGRIASASAIPALLSALAKPEADLWPRFAMFTALNRIGRAHPESWTEIVHGLDATNAAVQEAITFALRETFDEQLVQALAEYARAPARPIHAREAALRLLAAIHRQAPVWKGDWWAYHPFRLSPPTPTVDWAGTPIILTALRHALGDTNDFLRIAAIEGLRAADDQTAVPLIRAQVSDASPPGVRAAALRALGELGDAEAVALIVPLLQTPGAPADLRTAALAAAGKLAAKLRPPPASLGTTLIGMLADETAAERVRLDAIEAISQAALTNAITSLLVVARSPSPALGEAAVRALVSFGAPAALPALTQLAHEAPVAIQREAIAALGSLREKSTVPLLLEAARRDETRPAALLALTSFPAPESVSAYLDALATPDVVLREKARRALRDVGDGALPIIEKRAAELSPGVRAELRRVYEGRADVLAKPFLADVGAAIPSVDDYAKHASANAGDPWRGQRIFFDEQRMACARCHTVHGWGGSVGPDLTTAGTQFGRAALIEAILQPSKTVREGYQQVELELRNGENLSGIIKAESGAIVVLADVEGRVREVRRESIASRRSSTLSLMPEGLHVALSLDEFADLIAYLESLKTDPRQLTASAAPEGFQPLLNGRDLTGWHSADGREPNRNAQRPPKNWVFHDGVIEHDGQRSHLWTDREFGDFALRFEWRWVDSPKWEEFPIIGTDGQEARGTAGVVLRERVLDAGDSGVFVRGLFAAQANLFCYPVGSGEFWELREASVGETKRAFIPRRRADRPLGEWNHMEVTTRGDTVTVRLNGEEVISSARIPGLPPRGPIGFQHEHGRLQLANLFVRELGPP